MFSLCSPLCDTHTQLHWLIKTPRNYDIVLNFSDEIGKRPAGWVVVATFHRLTNEGGVEVTLLATQTVYSGSND